LLAPVELLGQLEADIFGLSLQTYWKLFKIILNLNRFKVLNEYFTKLVLLEKV